MKDWNQQFGKEQTLSGRDALRLIGPAICEGWQASMPPFSEVNLFGRKVHSRPTKDLYYLRGFLVQGLRASAVLSFQDILPNFPVLQQIARENLPGVIHLYPENEPLPSLPASWFRLVAGEPAEVPWLTLLAHRIAEEALVPGVLIHDYPDAATSYVDLPKDTTIKGFIGDPDDIVPANGPAQELLFGEQRRRLPIWFNTDTPSWLGIPKEGLSKGIEQAAQDRFLRTYLPLVIAEFFRAGAEAGFPQVHAIHTYCMEKADHLLITTVAGAEQAIDQLRLEQKARFGLIRLNQLNPFPTKQIAELIRGRKTITVIDRPETGSGAAATSYLLTQLKECLNPAAKTSPHLIAGFCNGIPTTSDFLLACKNVLKGGRQLERYYLDLAFVQATDNPIRQVSMQTVSRMFPGIEQESLAGPENSELLDASSPISGLPLSIRRYADKGAPYTRLSRFYHNTASVVAQNGQDALTADPFQALPTVPAATGGFAAPVRDQIPEFQASRCTGCGECLVTCPDNALPSLALTVEELLRAGIDLAAKQGKVLTRLNPILRNLAELLTGEMKQAPDHPDHVGPFLQPALKKLAEMSGLSGEKLEQTSNEISVIEELIGSFPVAVSDTYLNRAAALFSLAVDPYACTACGRCAEACPEQALSMVPSTEENEQQAADLFQLWESLPDTSGTTMQKLSDTEGLHPFTPVLLSRNFYHSMSGSGTKGHAGIRRMHHLIATTAEAVLQPKVAGQLKGLSELIGQLSDNIHHKLEEALPTTDFSGVSQALREAQGQRLPLEELMENPGQGKDRKLIDAPGLQRKIDLLEDLRDVHRLINSGPTGVGRARYGLVITSDIYKYPFNPFTVPVIQHPEALHPEAIESLWQGHLRHALDNIRIIRRAGLEAKDKYQSIQHDEEIAKLDWPELTETEKNLVPPLLIFTSRQKLGQPDGTDILSLLQQGWPVKIFCLEDPNEDPLRWHSLPALSAITSGFRGSVFQSGLETPDQLFACLRDAVGQPGPSIGYIYASETKGATGSRIWPVFRFTARPGQDFLSEGISLEGNPAPDEIWAEHASPENFLRQHQSWHNQLLPPSKENTIPLSDWLLKGEEERSGFTPVISMADHEQPLALSPLLARTMANCLRQWQYLRQVAGDATPFPEKLEKNVRAELEEEYTREMDRIRTELEQKWKEKEAGLLQDVKLRLRDKLVNLARKGKIES